MSAIYSTNNKINVTGVNIKNHDVSLYTDSDFNLYVKFLSTIAGGDGVVINSNYVKIGVLGNKTILNQIYDSFDLKKMFLELEPITI